MIESFRSMASSATAFVRSTVRSAEFICRRSESKGDSRSTVIAQLLSIVCKEVHIRPVLSKDLSASDSGYLIGSVEALVSNGGNNYIQLAHSIDDRPREGRRSSRRSHPVRSSQCRCKHADLRRGAYRDQDGEAVSQSWF